LLVALRGLAVVADLIEEICGSAFRIQVTA
jgi:hypothetical protein